MPWLQKRPLTHVAPVQRGLARPWVAWVRFFPGKCQYVPLAVRNSVSVRVFHRSLQHSEVSTSIKILVDLRLIDADATGSARQPVASSRPPCTSPSLWRTPRACGQAPIGTDPVEADSPLLGGNYGASVVWQHDPGKQDALRVTRQTSTARMRGETTRSQQPQQAPSQTTVILMDTITSVTDMMKATISDFVIHTPTERPPDANFLPSPPSHFGRSNHRFLLIT